ncbi:MAG: acetate/propionate family kinase [Candidatus Hydrogenedentota bacterium]
MKVLVLNSGSSSIKFKLFEADEGQEVCANGIAERIGLEGASIQYCFRGKTNGEYTDCITRNPENVDVPDHRTAIEWICQILLGEQSEVLGKTAELVAIGHRVVHGGEHFSEAVVVDDNVIEGIRDCARLAPLHNPPALAGIEAAQEHFAGIPQVAAFDTAFHQTMPPKAYLYGIPRNLYEKHGIRKYGFHGLSHQYVSRKAAEVLGKPIENTRIITCHLGNGCSITAVKGGKSIDTSMGVTPLAGVMMGTRSGDLDPYIPLFMVKELGMSPKEVEHTLNRESGLMGICNHADLRDVEDLSAQGDSAAALALDMFAYRVARYIGQYAMVLGGVDAVVFTAGIGENNSVMRSRILKNAGYLGIEIDEERNAQHAMDISAASASVRTLVVPTNEESVIVEETLRKAGEVSPRLRQTATA